MKKTLKTQIFFILLSFSGGFLDIFSFINRGGFSLMQTGNIIYSSIYLLNREYFKMLYSFILVILFFLSLIISNLLKKKINNVHLFRKMSILISIILLVVSVFMPIDFIYSGNIPLQVKKTWINLLGNGILSIVGAFLYNSIANSCKVNVTPTMMTANLGRFASSIVSNKKNSLFYLLIIFSFIVGLLGGYGLIYLIFNFYKFQNSYLDSLLNNLILLAPIIALIISYFLYSDEEFKDA